MRIGLVGRVLLGAAIPTLIAAAAFVTMVISIAELRQSQAHAAQSQSLVIAAEQLSRSVGEVTAAGRAHRPGEPAGPALAAAEQAVDGRSQTLTGMATKNAEQRDRVARVTAAAQAYATTVRTTGHGSEHDFISGLDALLAAEKDVTAADRRTVDAATDRAVVAASGGLIISIVAILGLGLYLTRTVALPIRRASGVAREFADGNLEARLPVSGTSEIHDLQHALNDMAGALSGARAELSASRARIAATTWQTRRELERNLHDGLQQRLVALNLDIRSLAADLPAGDPGLHEQVDRIGAALTGATEELREIARGIQPAVLTESGLRAALRTLARRSALPVEVTVDLPSRPAPDIESAAYYFCAEAVTNAIKHSRATYVAIDVHAGDAGLRISVHDDGIGGATGDGGTGLVGLRDRVEAAGGQMTIDSEPGHGTDLTALLPLA